MLRQQPLGSVPEDTARAVRAAFPKGHPYITFAEAFDCVYDYDDFTELYPALGQSAQHPARLTMVLILQFAEGLSDRAAADSVRYNILWKYMLRLPIEDGGFDYSVLSQHRSRLLQGGRERMVFDKLLSLAQDKALLKKGKQRTDSTFVLSKARNLSRLELVQETMRVALEALAVAAPGWLRGVLKPEWFDRYEKWGYNYRLAKTEPHCKKLTQDIGNDASYLLAAIEKDADWLKNIEAVAILARVLEEQFINTEHGLRFRETTELICSSERIASPHDTDARFSMKRTTECMGYKVHLSETFEPGGPHLITNVETTPATTQDSLMLPIIHRSLSMRGMKPSEHLVDAGYTDAQTMLNSRDQHDIDVIGPLKDGNSWQAAANKGFDVSYFKVDFEQRTVVCPQGITNSTWRERKKRGAVEVVFPKSACASCPFRSDCTKSESGPRRLEIKARPEFEFMQQHRRRERTDEFKQKYAKRSGVEGTQSQAARSAGMRRSRYSGLAKTSLQNFLGATAINLTRLAVFLHGIPLAVTRRTQFQRLAAA